MRRQSGEESDSDSSNERISDSEGGDDANDEDEKGFNIYSIRDSQGEPVSARNEPYDETSNGDLRFLDIRDEDFYDRMAAMLTGTTTGRQFKRAIFKYGVIHLFLGVILIVLSSYEGFSFPVTPFFQSATHGASVLMIHQLTIRSIISNKSLMWMVSFPIFFIGILSFIASYYWASLCSNRQLFMSLIKVYLGYLLYLFAADLWCVSVILLTFKKDAFKDVIEYGNAVPCAVISLLAQMPLLLSLFLHFIDILYLKDQLVDGGTLVEIDPPAGTRNLNGISIAHLCGLFVAVPYNLFLQIVDVLRTSYKFLTIQPASRNGMLCDKDSTKGKKWQRSCFKLIKRIIRCYGLCCSGLGRKLRINRQQRAQSKVIPDDEDVDVELTEQLHQPVIHILESKEKEEFEIAEIEKVEMIIKERAGDREKATEQEVEHQAIKYLSRREQDIEGHSLEAEEITKRKKKIEEDSFQAEEDAELQWRKQQRMFQYQVASKQRVEVIAMKEREKSYANEIPSDSYFNEKMFESVWTSMSIAGTFNCHLKKSPIPAILVKHIEKQGFHVASSSSSSSSIDVGSGVEFEIQFCNILNRPKKEGLFLCKFTVVKNIFTASMKAENLDDISMHVKRFSLAKILKVDIPS